MYRFLNILPQGASCHATLKTKAASTSTVHFDYHPHHEIYFCPCGIEQNVVINGQAHILNQPSVIVNLPFSVHGMSKHNDSHGDFPRYTVYFNDEFIERECRGAFPEGMVSARASCIYLLTPELCDVLKTVFDRMIDAEGYPTEFAAYLIAAMHTLERLVPREDRIHGVAPEGHYIIDVLRHIYNEKRPPSADELAREFHVSRAKLDRDFRRYVGQTLHTALNTFRIGRAVELLLGTDMKVRDIANECGFSDEYYFYAFFKKATGKTPLAVRREKLAQERK